VASALSDLLLIVHRKDAEHAERWFICLVTETPTRQNSLALGAIKITAIKVTGETIPAGGLIFRKFAGG
jgi:hypothetical protein